MAKLHIWHRYTGVTISIFVLLLSLTGLLLNLSDDLKLGKSHIRSSWLLDYYNIGLFNVTSFQVDNQLISQASKYVYIDGHYVLDTNATLLGAAKLNDFILLATQKSLILIQADGQIVDEIGKHTGLPENPLTLSINKQGFPVIQGATAFWKGTDELSTWQPLNGAPPKPILSVETPNNINTLIQAHARGQEINIERVLLDLHSGRLLGKWGIYVMSTVATLLLLLAISGVVVWLQKKR